MGRPPGARALGGGICGQVRLPATKLDETCHTDCSVCGSRFGVLSIWSVLYRCDVKQIQRHQLTRLDTQSLGFLQP